MLQTILTILGIIYMILALFLLIFMFIRTIKDSIRLKKESEKLDILIEEYRKRLKENDLQYKAYEALYNTRNQFKIEK